MPYADPIIAAGRLIPNNLGLNVSGTGFTRGGQPWRGIGINHFALFLNELQDMGVGGIGGYSADMTAIKQTWGLPFIRFAVGPYDRTSWNALFRTNKSAFYAKLDAIVAKAEALGVGLMPVLLWDVLGFCQMTYDRYGTEDLPPKLADKSSNLWAMFSEYVSEVVTRYRSSPAIWAWCLGNEIANKLGPEYYSGWIPDGSTAAWMNWGTRPGGGTYPAGSFMSMRQWTDWTSNAVQLINNLDGYGRYVSSGTPIGNSFAVGAQTANTLTADTLAQWQNAAYNLPWVVYEDQSFPIICRHIYPLTTGDAMFFNGAQKTGPEVVALCKAWADSVNRPFVLEEFGATCHGDTVDQVTPQDGVSIAAEATNWTAMLNSVMTNNIQVSAAWNYGGNFSGGSAWMKWKMSDPAKTYQLTALATANQSYRLGW